MKAQPSEQIVISAHITSSAPSVFIAWHHGNNSYVFSHIENPICEHDRTKVRTQDVQDDNYVTAICFLGM